MNDRERLQHPEAMFLKCSEKKSPNLPQDMWLYNGLILIAYLPIGVKQEVHNGMLMQIMSFDPHDVKLKDIESGEMRELKLDFVRANLRLAFAFTNVGCQGRSLGNFAEAGIPSEG